MAEYLKVSLTVRRQILVIGVMKETIDIILKKKLAFRLFKNNSIFDIIVKLYIAFIKSFISVDLCLLNGDNNRVINHGSMETTDLGRANPRSMRCYRFFRIGVH